LKRGLVRSAALQRGRQRPRKKNQPGGHAVGWMPPWTQVPLLKKYPGGHATGWDGTAMGVHTPLTRAVLGGQSTGAG